MSNDFEAFPKVARLSRNMVITEKIDGTNAQVCIDDLADPENAGGISNVLATQGSLVMRAGSRTRYITPEDDNYGFARWVKANSHDLFNLGVGRHFGEWWGQGIQRTYGLSEKRFSLFNAARWADAVGNQSVCARPACCHVVPVLYSGPFETDHVQQVLEELEELGSLAAPGFMKPEGVMVWHEAARMMFKKTIVNDEVPKGSWTSETASAFYGLPLAVA